MSDALARLKAAVGDKGFTEDQTEIAPYLEEWRSKYQGKTSLMLKPATTEQVSAVLAICNETGTHIVPQGGNTGLVGGQIPFHGEVLLSLRRMKQVAVDAKGMTMTAAAGCCWRKHKKRLTKRAFVPPYAGLGRLLHHRRQYRHQCRRQSCDPLRHDGARWCWALRSCSRTAGFCR
jgi:FAD/FMN-containing dehydrogenase